VSDTPFQSAAWYAAATLSERIALRRAEKPEPSSFEVNADLSERRAERWRSQSPFDKGSYFGQRLAGEGISEEEFRQILGEPPEAVAARHAVQPRWLAETADAFDSSVDLFSGKISLQPLKAEPRASAFMTLVQPLVERGRQRLRDALSNLPTTRGDLPFKTDTVEDLLYENLPIPLASRLSRTLALELNVARLQGLLTGDTPEERFQNFIQRLQEREHALAILEEYPVLTRQVVMLIDNWLAFSSEFLRNLCADWDDIVQTFCGKDDPGILVQVKGGAGDSHKGGRSVLIAKFSSGLQVVYKPRSLSIDLRFQELLNWLNERGAQPPFATFKVLDKQSHGWAEFVAAKSCRTAEEVERFYRRQGGYLALLYALEATDFHFENLIAAGEHPFLIDLEALFQARVEGEVIKQADALANSTATHSVLRVGLLPQRAFSKDDYEGIDVSGLGGAAGQFSPHQIMQWEKAGTDEMRIVRQRVQVAHSDHRPTLNGAEVNILNYRQALADGFTEMYRLLLKHREELLSDDSPLARFAGTEVRAIVRDTHTYALLLQESFHPDFLRDALDRDLFLDRLWIGVASHSYLARTVEAEHLDLMKGDIPAFSTHPESRHLWSSSQAQISNFFDEPGMTLARRRIEHLSERDLEQQLWFLNASLTTLSIDLYRDNWPTYPVFKARKKAGSQQFLNAARAVGDRLEELALRTGAEATWLGVVGVDGRHCALAQLDSSLYEGVPGVALFLAYLGAACGEERYVELAKLAQATMRRQVQRVKPTLERIGAFAGWGGFIYTLTHLGVLWNDSELLSEADDMVEHVSALVERDDTFDIINGSAGCIAALIALYQCLPNGRALDAAIKCGDHLISSAQVAERGVAWDTKVPAQKLPCGFSHGAAGIAWALMELSALTGEERFRNTAQAGMEYERSLFSTETGNWMDGRDLGSFGRLRQMEGSTIIATWCYGAPGVGLARLGALRYISDSSIIEEVERALQITLDQGFGLNHSLCHGDLGNLELLLQASRLLSNTELAAQVNRLSSMVLESIELHGWLCGIPLGVESPGLMPGLAGIGYQLLRLAEPERVPSVLTLQPPRYKCDA
jgi:type 2 lantibiotic biosynthesis protein LanM